ncbi:MAG TPA: ribosome silencing factor [Actinomycetota bacterium]|nr:ribosome silencing factor [Actinomycetota bacterium]
MDDSLDVALAAAHAASEKLAEDIVILDVQSLIGITDYFVICSGRNERQVQTILEEIQKRLGDRGRKPLRREGEHQLRWVLLDYGDFVVHIFHAEERQFYELERLWKDANRIPADPSDRAAAEVDLLPVWGTA